MKKQVFNPYLPSWEYVPDGEPHIFGDRVYVYGSHDKFNGEAFCMNDYVCWSAPVNDLSDWRYDGVIYKKNQDIRNKDSKENLWAPDVCKAPDGKFYLYYCLSNKYEVGVAVSDLPTGPFEFYGLVRHKNGKILGGDETEVKQFDPGVFVDDDGRIYLYSGGGTRFKRKFSGGGMKMELESDMLTIKDGPYFINIPHINIADGTPFEEHPFYEASSMRKFNGKYYFIYSSSNTHELCWAVCDTPLGEFEFGGTLVSNADLYLNGNMTLKNYFGNTHGSVEKINDKYYVFYHRQTNRHCFSRQACAEEIKFDGEKFCQAPITSCGLNGGALRDIGYYEARIACHLWSKNGATESCTDQNENHPCFTQTGVDRENNPDQYISNMLDGATAGYKYFDFKNAQKISVKIKSGGNGKFVVKDDENGNIVSEINICPCSEATVFSSEINIAPGVHPLYFTYKGTGAVDFFGFELF